MKVMEKSILALALLVGCLCWSQQTESENDSLRTGAEDQISSEDKIQDILLYYGWMDFGPEYYRISSESSFVDYHLLYQPFLTDRNVFQFEFGLVSSTLESGSYFTPGDLHLIYRHNLFSNKRKEPGYQGMGLSMKFTFPTGRKENLSGFNSWTIEPQVGAQWKLKNDNWLTSVALRYNYSFASTDEEDPREQFLRIDYEIGYENKLWWVFFEPDLRYIPSKGNATAYLALNTGLKMSRRTSLRLKYKPRVYGSDFFETFLNLGLTWFLK